MFLHMFIEFESDSESPSSERPKEELKEPSVDLNVIPGLGKL